MQWNYQFDCPKKINLLINTEKARSHQICLDRREDRWFMIQHDDMSSTKSNFSVRQVIQKCQPQQIKQRFQIKPIKRNVNPVNTQQQLDQKLLKKNLIPKGNKKQNAIHKNNSLHPIKAKTKSFSEAGCKKSKHRLPPCPYPARLQRQWQNKSKKSWYSLSQESAMRAEMSMKKMQKYSKPKEYQLIAKKNIKF